MRLKKNTSVVFILSGCLLILGITKFTLAAVENASATIRPRANVSIDKKYYENLDKMCKARYKVTCCQSSVKTMRAGNYLLAPSTDCPQGYRWNKLSCADSFAWCEPKQVREDRNEK